MADHEVDITVLDTDLGTPQEDNGIMMIFVMAVAVANTFNLNTAYLLTSMDDLAALGIDAAYDAANGTAVYQQVNDYYTQGGPGTLLWLVGVAKNTEYATFIASTTHDQLVMFTGQADPVNQAKMIGYCYAPPTATQAATDFPADVTASITAAHTKQQQLFALGFHYCWILDGYNMSSTQTPGGLTSMTTYTSFSGSLCITGTQPNGVSAVGLALGRFARITIGHAFGAVDDGAIAAAAAYLTNSVTIQAGANMVVGHVMTVFGAAPTDTVTYNGNTYKIGAQFTVLNGLLTFTTNGTGYVADNCTPVGNIPGVSNSLINGLTPTEISQLGQKQFLFLRTWIRRSGLYWNDGATCISTTKSLAFLEYNRVANALSDDALDEFIGLIGSQPTIDKATGNVAQGWLNTEQEKFYDTYIEPLNDTAGTGDITDGQLILSGKNFTSTRQLSFQIKVEPAAAIGGVGGTVQFVASL